MRVISGSLKGRIFNVSKSAPLRPTTDRVREAVFSALQSMIDFEGIRVLDLFCGSGAFGIESLSRGAAHCTFVEKNAELAQTLRENVKLLNIEAQATIVRNSTEEQLRRFAESAKPRFQLIFADPPYAENFEDLPLELAAAGIVEEGSIFVFETAPVRPEPEKEAKIELNHPHLCAKIKKYKRYGDSAIRFHIYE